MSAEELQSWDALARAAARGDDAEGSAAPELHLLTFLLDGARYALPVEQVREIVRLRPATPVPRVGEDVLGVISLRGDIVQVIDLRRRLALGADAPGPRARIVIVNGFDERIGGLLVDAVDEVLKISADALQSPTADAAAVEAIAAVGERFVSVLDLERVWSLHAGD